jgi:hypothetical protein
MAMGIRKTGREDVDRWLKGFGCGKMAAALQEEVNGDDIRGMSCVNWMMEKLEQAVRAG